MIKIDINRDVAKVAGMSCHLIDTNSAIEMSFDSSWGSLVKVAIFSVGNLNIPIPLGNGLKCVVPIPESMNREGGFSVYVTGSVGSETVVVTNYCEIVISQFPINPVDPMSCGQAVPTYDKEDNRIVKAEIVDDCLVITYSSGKVSNLGRVVGDMQNPMIEEGDMIVADSDGRAARLAKGTDGQILTMQDGTPEWEDNDNAPVWGNITGSITDQTDLDHILDLIDDDIDTKMDKANPSGTGSFSLNRKADTQIGNYSFAEGYQNEASGVRSHAEGLNTSAKKSSSHAEGEDTVANGIASHAEGDETTTNAIGSHAEGYNTLASSSYQHVQGKYNVEDTDDVYADTVGNGTSNANRSNASALDWDGNLHLMGDVYVGCEADSSGGTTVVKNNADGVSEALNKLTTGSAAPIDGDYYISQYAGHTRDTYHRRPVSALWNYIKGKINEYNAYYKMTDMEDLRGVIDLNTITTPGSYMAAGYTGQELRNQPELITTTNMVSIRVIRYSPNYLVQMLERPAGHRYYRFSSNNGSTWGEWTNSMTSSYPSVAITLSDKVAGLTASAKHLINSDMRYIRMTVSGALTAGTTTTLCKLVNSADYPSAPVPLAVANSSSGWISAWINVNGNVNIWSEKSIASPVIYINGWW